MSGSWARALQQRELSGGRPEGLAFPPRPNTGVLILDPDQHTVNAIPGGLLSHIEGRVHYLDLAGVQAHSLSAFGGNDELWRGITKLYASHSGLQSLEGLQRCAGLRFLYLDHNALGEAELLRLPGLLPPSARLEALDLSGNPGCTPRVEAALLASGVLAAAQFLNGRRLTRR